MYDPSAIAAPGDDIEALAGRRLLAWQTKRLTSVIDYARRQVPFYRDLWAAADVDTAVVDSLLEFERLPIVNKTDLVRAGTRWANPHRGPVAFSTRGTSGDPLLVWLSAEEEEAYIVPTMRGFRWAGFEPGMTAMLMSPVWHRLAACEAHAIARLGGRCAFFWGSMGPEYFESFLNTLRETRPEFVTSAAPFVLGLIRACGASLDRLREATKSVRSISLVGLPLTPRMREYLRERLGVGDVFERAGTQEGAALDECAMHNTPHVHEDVCYLEVVDETGIPVAAGQRGRLLVTKLSTAGSIFIRYDTGDIAAFAPGECACGSGFQRLKIYGRPESSVVVGARRVTAYDVRMCIEEDASLVGRNVLLVRDAGGREKILTIAVEGEPHDPTGLEARLRTRLAVNAVRIVWLGDLRINWGFRQVFDSRDLGLAAN